jgi:hypothetical protein
MGLNGVGGIGTAARSLKLAVGMLNAVSGNAPMFLASVSTTTLRSNGLNAGTNAINLTGGTFALSANNQLANASALHLNGATLKLGTFTDSLASLALNSTSTFGILVNAFSAGNFGSLSVNGAINLGNANLDLTLKGGFSAPPPGTTIVLIRNLGNAAVVGQFAGLPNNGTLSGGGFTFRISYTGGAGHDVTLTSL